ncbi:MAG: CatB-related O-acetyltransferase [Spirochaetes bacterium]|nr:CatB-related O-acetyltransferase [Spirochaetota bacterium]
MKTEKEGCEHFLAKYLLYPAFGIIKSLRIRKILMSLILKLEKGELYTITLRKIFNNYFHLDIGMYSEGGCFVLFNFTHTPPATKIGRYCSFANSIKVFNANHPMNLLSTHAFFFNPWFGLVKEDILARTQLTIGNDVWIGHNAVIMPSVSRIGDGAVIGANSVVSQDVPDFAVVSGFPARILRYRFDPDTIKKIKESSWWDKSIRELSKNIKEFQKPFDGSDTIV